MKDERGTALIEMVVIGSATLLMVLPILVGVARLADEATDVHTAAVDAAAWVARHGVLPAESDGNVRLSVAVEGADVRVVAESDVALFGVGGATVSVHVTRGVVVPISRYRSAVP
ncbi:MAG: hypothetical protein ACR2N7_05785 [Acidimicrobiia bacterium]